MSIEFFTRLPLHGETQFLPGDPRNRGDWHAGGPSTGAVSGFSVGDHFTYIDYLGQIARAAEINGFGGALMVNAPTGEAKGLEPRRFECTVARKDHQVGPRNLLAILLLDRPEQPTGLV